MDVPDAPDGPDPFLVELQPMAKIIQIKVNGTAITDFMVHSHFWRLAHGTVALMRLSGRLPRRRVRSDRSRVVPGTPECNHIYTLVVGDSHSTSLEAP